MAIRILISCWLLLTLIYCSLCAHTQERESQKQTNVCVLLVHTTPQISSRDKGSETPNRQRDEWSERDEGGVKE